MKNLIVLVFVMICSVGSYAQKTWTLEACIAKTLENSLDVQKSIIANEYAGINVTQAEHNRYPSLSASSGVNLSFGRSINPITNQFETQSFLSNNYGLNSQVIVYNGMRLTNSLRQAKTNLAASELDAEQIKSDLVMTVMNAFLNVLFATENMNVAEAQLDNTKQQLERTQKLVKSGMQPKNVTLEIEAQIATSEQAVINAENAKATAMLRLKQLMRVNQVEEIELEVPEVTLPTTDPDKIMLEELYAQSRKSQPRLKASLLRQKSAALGVQIAKSGLLPSIGAGASMSTNYSNRSVFGTNDGYFDQLSNNLGYGVGLSMNVPIYQNYTNKLNVERAKLNVIDSANQTTTLEDNLRVTVQKALTDARLAKRKLTAADKSVNAQAAALQNSQKRYENGVINTFELNAVQNNVTQAKVNALIAKYEYIQALKVVDFYMGEPIKL